jgi:hypothetical protein
MNIIEIDKFINDLKTEDKSSYSLSKIRLLPPAKLYNIIYQTNDNEFQDKYSDRLIDLIEIVDTKTSFLFGNNDFINTNKILGAIDNQLFLLKKINFIISVDIKLKYIYSLTKTDFILEAIHHAFFIQRICIQQLKNSNDKLFIRNVYLKMRNMFSYMKLIASQNGLYEHESQFKQIYKNIDLMLLYQNYITNIYDFDICKAYRDGQFMHFCITGNNLSDYSKVKEKIIFRLKLSVKIFSNLISKYFWGYGESIKRICLNSLIIILAYSLAIYFNIIHTKGEDLNCISSLYFSIVTFTSLGYGDIRPDSDNLSRILMSFEAIIGVVCIALIVFILGRRSK